MKCILVTLILCLTASATLRGSVYEELEEKREVRLLIQGITSKEHIERVIAAIQTIKGVISVGVDIKEESEAVAIVKKDVDPQKLIEAVQKAGFKAHLRSEEKH